MRGTTMLDLGARNELIVLAAIRHAPDGTSQSEVVHRSGLSRQAVSLITRRLRERSLITSDGTLAGSRGKPRTVLRIVPSALLAAGIHLDPSGISIVVVDLLASVVTQRSLAAPTDDPTADIARIADALTALQEDLGAAGWRTPDGREAREAMLGIGVASPGGIDVRRGVVVNPPWLPGWRDVPLVEQLEHATGLPVVLDKDTNAALTAETWSAAQSPDETVLYIYVGAGVGSAVSTGGRVHHGAEAQAGEIGHLPTGLEGPECGCGRRACLSRFTDVSMILGAAEEQGILPADPRRSSAERLQDLAAAAEADRSGAAALIEGYGIALGEALRTLIGVHDPHRLVLGGPHWRALAPFALPRIEERVRRDAPSHRVRIDSSHLGDGVAALGAATLFLQRELSPASR
ncbi:ROK family protein [Brachybacterium sp. AOP43-C2-M15]|uniref:ROK family protein n=1 Tax=Brachybacterium sp. AOP43-C2-M15 TaxID=3457661 RepID=UPI004033D655